jgi:DNA-binding transcriptional MocR family regulator
MVFGAVQMDISPAELPLVGQVMEAIRHRIAARLLSPGAKLPSIRAFAETMRVSKSTVVEAYDRLAADSVIQARRGSGFYVAGHAPPLALAARGPELDRAIDPLWVSRQSLETGDDLLKPGCGWLPPSWMPETCLRRSLRAASRGDEATMLNYATPRGLLALRQWLSRRLNDREMNVHPDQIILTESGTQAVDLLCRFLLEPGDTVILDDPCYFNFHALLRAHRANIVTVSYTPMGPDLVGLEAALTTHRPRLYITNAGPHNPTGATMSPATAHRLLKLSERHDLTIIEDDIFADFETKPAPRLAAFDGLVRVVHVGSFSKTLSAGVRCGYIAARADWIEGLIDLKIASSFGSSALSAALVLGVLQDSGYRKHLEGLRDRLSQAMGRTIAQLKPLGILPWIEPQAGMFLWARLPDGVDASDIAKRALTQNIVLAPGNVFSPTRSASQFLRFNVAQSDDLRLYRWLGDVIAD